MRHDDLTPSLGAAIAAAVPAAAGATRPHGVKFMGPGEDTRWVTDEGRATSVREVDTALADARVALAILRDETLPQLRTDLEDSDRDLRQRLSDIVVDGGDGASITYSVHAPSGGGTVDGDTWWQVQDGEVLGQWHWSTDTAAWVPVTLTDAVLAGVDVSLLTASKGHVAESVVDRLFADIFAAHKITADEIAAGSVTAETLAADAITAEKITGGSFTGETFTGGEFVGGRYRTSDSLPGQVTLADDAGGQGYPGLRIDPVDKSGLVKVPIIRPMANGMQIHGGRNTDGQQSLISANPNTSSLAWIQVDNEKVAAGSFAGVSRNRAYLSVQPDYGATPANSAIEVQDGQVKLSTQNAGSDYSSITSTSAGSDIFVSKDKGTTVSRIRADTTVAEVSYSSPTGFAQFMANDHELTFWREPRTNGKSTRQDIFTFDSNGLTYKQADITADGSFTNVRWTKFGDSGWISVPGMSGIVAGSAPPTYRALNSVVYFQGAVQKQSNWTAGWNQIAQLPSGYRPGAPALRVAASTVFGKALLQVNTLGVLEVWVDRDYPGSTNLQLSTMTYPFG